MSKVAKSKRLLARTGGAAGSFSKCMKSRLLAMASNKADDRLSDTVPNDDAMPIERTPMQIIMDRREGLEAQAEASARRGYIGEGLPFSLLENHEDELAERRRLLTELQRGLTAGLLKLGSLCPLAPEPEPAPLPPPRPRKFTPPSDWFANGAAGQNK